MITSLPQQIPPQTASFGTITKDGQIIVDINWYLFLYNIASLVLSPNGIPVTPSDLLAVNEIDVINSNVGNIDDRLSNINELQNDIPASIIDLAETNQQVSNVNSLLNDVSVTIADIAEANQKALNALLLANDASLSTSSTATQIAGGDLSGFYPDPIVSKINGVALGSTTATSGNILIGSGSAWVTKAISGDATLASTGALTLASVVSGSTNTKITYNAKGLVTAGSQASASDLSNGTTGTGSIVLDTSPTFTADIKTADPTSGTGPGWKLGTVKAGAVAMDAANYVEVDIGGTIYKLLKAV